ncbi:hypothetical protein ACHAXR_002088 [Thalassiosira sp. AJA248-18]
MQHASQQVVGNQRPRSRHTSRHGDKKKMKKQELEKLVVYDPASAARKKKKSQVAPKLEGSGLKIRTVDVRTAYKVLPIVIGTGSFGTVRSCVHRETKTKLAIKSIGTKGKGAVNDGSLLKNEIALLQRVNHANVVKVVDVIQDSQYIHIIMEQCRGGDLFDVTVDGKTRLGEGRICNIIGSLLDAIAYLHDRDIVHRDLKAEHLMFSGSDINSTIKIIDFGVATVHKRGDAPMTAFAGSLRSMAPEVIKRSYGRECDIWSVGIITYFLLMQQFPFDSPSGNQNEIFQKIVSGNFYYPKWAEMGISDGAKDFIDRLIVVDPRKRLTAKQALAGHAWIRNKKGTKAQKKPKPQAMGRAAVLPIMSHATSVMEASRSRSRARSKSRHQSKSRSKSRATGDLSRSRHSKSRSKSRATSRSRHRKGVDAC